jgi:hypothetical protein
MERRPMSDAGRQRIGAARLGISVKKYRLMVRRGRKWCWGCGRWQTVKAFGSRRTTPDGLNNECLAANAAKARERMRRYRERRAS